MVALLAPIVPIAVVRHALYVVSPLPSPTAQAAWLASYRAWDASVARVTELRGLREVVLAKRTPEASLAARAWIPVVRQALAESKSQPWARHAAADLLGELGDPRSHVRMLPARAETKHLEYHELTNPVGTTLWTALHVPDSPPDVRGFRLRMDNPARSRSSNSLTVRIGLQNDDSGNLYSVVFGRSGTVNLNIMGTASIERRAPPLDADEDAQLELRVNDAGEFAVDLNGHSLWSGPGWEDGVTPVIQVWGMQGGRADLAFRDIEVLRNGRWERRALRFEGGIPGLSLVADGDVTRLSGLFEGPRAQTAHAAFGFQGVRGARWSMTTNADPATAALGSSFAWAMLQDTRAHAGFVQIGWGAFPQAGIGAPTFFVTSGQGYDGATYQTMWLPRGSGPLIGNAGADGSVHRYELRVRDDGEAVIAVDGVEIYGPTAGPLYSTLMPAEPLHIAFSIEPQAVGQKLDVVFKDIEVLKGDRWVKPDHADDTYVAPGLFVRDEGGGVWRTGGVHTGDPGPKA
jgi:hypothetical protein